jgi:hypothetical protein
MEPFTLLPDKAVDLTLYWPWAGESYAMMKAGVYRFAIQLEWTGIVFPTPQGASRIYPSTISLGYGAEFRR